jgi:hypothetical protein
MELIKNGKVVGKRPVDVVLPKKEPVKEVQEKVKRLDLSVIQKEVTLSTNDNNLSEWKSGFGNFKEKYLSSNNLDYISLKKYLSGKVFKFYNKKGLVTENLYLHSSGRVYGIHSMNEAFWGIENNKLVFLNNFQKTTTYFDKLTDNGFKGNFLLEQNFDHILEFKDLLFPDKTKLEFVVAKYKEDVGWTDLFINNCTIYSKSPFQEEFKTIKLENIGREANTYLYHIVHNYNRLAEYTMFMQGYPFDHQLFRWEDYFSGKELFVGTSNARRNADSGQYRFDRTFAEWFWKKYIGKDRGRMPEVLIFGNGAEFSVHKSLILRKPIEYWKELLVLSRSDNIKVENKVYPLFAVGYMLEVMWRHIFESEPV